jgi:prepilin-type N-terminal cleavage/methylation domain-containing protein
MKYLTAKFTLIEMLIVIAIISLLVGLLTPTFLRIRDKAKETKAKAEMHSIMTAIKSYEMTYGVLPLPTGIADSGLIATGGVETEYPDLMTFLTNVGAPNKTAGVTGNTRGVRFLDVPDNYTNAGFTDPWEQDYSIYLDTDYDGVIVGPDADAVGGQGTTSLYGTIFIYTHTGGDETDTLYSWK